MAATSTIPIVAITGDPVAAGLITSLAHPGGNLTGVSIDPGIAIAKRLQILKEAIPRAAKVTYLLSNVWRDQTGLSYRETAQQMGIALTGSFLPAINVAAPSPRRRKRSSTPSSSMKAAAFWRTAP